MLFLYVNISSFKCCLWCIVNNCLCRFIIIIDTRGSLECLTVLSIILLLRLIVHLIIILLLTEIDVNVRLPIDSIFDFLTSNKYVVLYKIDVSLYYVLHVVSFYFLFFDQFFLHDYSKFLLKKLPAYFFNNSIVYVLS